MAGSILSRLGFKKAAEKTAPAAPAMARPVAAPPPEASPPKSMSRTEWIDELNSASDATREKILFDVGYRGLPADTKALAGVNSGWGIKKPLLDGAIQSFKKGNPENLRAFFSGYVSFKRRDGKSQQDEGYDNLIVNPILALMEQSTEPEKTLPLVLGALEKEDARQDILNMLLLNACKQDQQKTVGILLTTGADPYYLNAQPLYLALNRREGALARFMVMECGVNIDIAFEKSEKDKVSRHAIGTFMMQQICEENNPEKIKQAAMRDIAPWGIKKPLLEYATKTYTAGDPQPLQAFFSGYIAFKRGEELTRQIDDGLKTLLLEPMIERLQKSDAPQERTLHLLLEQMTPEDKKRTLDMLLRHACRKETGDLPLVKTLLEFGADPCALNNQPLVNAVGAGHTEIALMLIRDHGANIADAILDIQINQPQNSSQLLQKMHACMLATYTPPKQVQTIVKLPPSPKK